MADGIVWPPRSRERQAADGHESRRTARYRNPLRRERVQPARPGASSGALPRVRCLPCGRGARLLSSVPPKPENFAAKGAVGCGPLPRSTRPSSPRPWRAAASATSSSPPSPSRGTRAGSRRRSRSGWPASACGTSTRSTSSASPGRTSRRRRAACSTSGNWIEFPSELTGVEARIVGLVGKYFPIGAHKVGAAFGCLVPRLVSGRVRSRRRRRPSGPRPATTAAAAPSTARCSAARPSPSCPRA